VSLRDVVQARSFLVRLSKHKATTLKYNSVASNS